MNFIRRLRKVLRYGVGADALERRRADKRRAKQVRFESDAWRREAGFARRHYASYDEYVAHQSSKLGGIIDRLRETDAKEFDEFRARFSACGALVQPGSALCLGARLGTEVRALRSLGHFAVGIDLDPGPKNAYVLHGDFHDLLFPDGSTDVVYTNAMDHVFDLERMIGEVARVLRTGGRFVAEVDEGFREGGIPGDYEAMHWERVETLIERVSKIGSLEVEEVQELGRIRRGVRRLVVFRKPL